mmetsp:Transcript_4484/g.11497  ORF Transcript_4484/g.11497 Transcript_4484/m.11497 type:complete len:296 (+) Transcript_4484:1155-2042(+)
MIRPASRSTRTSCVSLWCVLMHSALPETSLEADSIRSGRSVPCARYTSSAWMPRSVHIFCVTRMKVSPMIFRLTSGETCSSSGPSFLPSISVNAFAKSSVASSLCSSTPIASSATTTFFDSLSRMKPWSTCSAITRSLPSALCSSAAHTDESTPPETSTRTFLTGPTISLISAMAMCSRLTTVKLACSPQMPNRKFFIICLPSVDRSTSGWNCTPYRCREASAMPTMSSPECATSLKPSGTEETESPCVSSTSVPAGTSAKSAHSVTTVMGNWPSSRRAFFSTLPPKWWLSSCMP